ncbi:hypothetical protein V6N11_024476 [Hibiscus sabdariffa]|uniref:Uncharacterized protein n=1 Tax=Hibiscus sabdariffa TaxID=183260 RepID=A0ABR2QM83_9ROSI
MRAMNGVLKVWNRDSFGNVDSNYRALVDEIEQLNERLNGGELDTNELVHKHELYSKLWVDSRLRELVWWKKSMAIWLGEGDKNTKFFHKQERMRMVRNGITGILYNGQWETKPERLKFIFVKEF